MAVGTFRIIGIAFMILGWVPMILGQTLGTSIRMHSLGLAGMVGMVAGFVLIGISSTIGKSTSTEQA